MSNDATFPSLGVPAPLVAALAARQITVPTPIQAATLPDSLAGRDVLGRGRTGSGKTYGFALPLVARLTASGKRRQPKRPRAIVLVPTRELATQVDEAIRPLAATAGLTTRTVFGGVGQGPQVDSLRKGVDIVVACPGRLEDLIGQGHAVLDQVEITVLDEADHMADLGFLPGVKRILDRTPSSGQRMLFSATLDNAVDQLVKRYLHEPVIHEADSAQSPVVEMTHHVLHVNDDAHLPVLLNLTSAPGRTIVFTRTKHRAKRLARQLNASGVRAVELHGNLSQNARQATMDAFHSGAAQTLVATDIAARGIHVDDVRLVIHADPPVEHKAYLHRSGRTARAGAAGTVVTMMTNAQVSDVRKLTRQAGVTATTTKVDASHPLLEEIAPGVRSRRKPLLPEDGPVRAPRAQHAGQRGERQRSSERQGQPSRNGSSGRGQSTGRATANPRAAGSGRPAGARPAGAGRPAGASRGRRPSPAR